jgi:hypothetical protein
VGPAAHQVGGLAAAGDGHHEQGHLVLGGEGVEEGPGPHGEAVAAGGRHDRGDEEGGGAAAHAPARLAASSRLVRFSSGSGESSSARPYHPALAAKRPSRKQQRPRAS